MEANVFKLDVHLWTDAYRYRLDLLQQPRRLILYNPLLLSDIRSLNLLYVWVYLLRQSVSVCLQSCPERSHPGRYDVCGHSHQIWHTFAVLGIILSYLAILICYEIRKQSLFCPLNDDILFKN